jgi:hypothetical protein
MISALAPVAADKALAKTIADNIRRAGIVRYICLETDMRVPETPKREASFTIWSDALQYFVQLKRPAGSNGRPSFVHTRRAACAFSWLWR